MPSLRFRFNAECQLTLTGSSYEEAYMQFKELMHGTGQVPTGSGLQISPPDDPTILFEVEDQAEYNTIERFKGDFVDDIVMNCPEEQRAQINHPKRVS